MVLALLVLFLGTGLRVWDVGTSDDPRQAETILVLGAAQYDGKPSRILQARLDHAAELYRQGKAQYVVTVGGRKPTDRFTEAEAGERYLASVGVPASKIFQVDSGSDTLNSLVDASKLYRSRGWTTAIIVSDPWHELRASTMAADQGITAYPSPTRTGPVAGTSDPHLAYLFHETLGLLFYRATKLSADSMENK
jgi:vancomycin permeability regulator SanA